MKKIVSANYQDRSSAFKWLLRDENKGSEDAVAFKFIKATGVEIKDSNTYEQGFGCQVVAFCDQAEGHNGVPEFKKEGLSKLIFGIFFFRNEAGERVDKIEELYLDVDGSIWALLPVNVPEPEFQEEDCI